LYANGEGLGDDAYLLVEVRDEWGREIAGDAGEKAAN